MKNISKLFLLLVVFVFVGVLTASQRPNIKHVIVIGVDGMSPDGIAKAHTPVMDKMMSEGAYTMQARAVLPSSSSSNWASMIMAAQPEFHGITSNDWRRDNFTLPPIVVGSEEIFPTIFGVLNQHNSAMEIGSIYDWGGFGRLYEKSAVDYDFNGSNEETTTMEAVKYIKNKAPNFLFIHLDHVDHAGHKYGHGSAHYYHSVAKADSLIGAIVKAVQTSKLANNTLIIISSDHGGMGKGHGGETIEEMTIPFILWGKDVKKDFEIEHTVITTDNAATAAWALQAQTPYAWTGRAVKSAFIGHAQPNLKLEKRMLQAPTIHPRGDAYNPAGGLFIENKPILKITHANPKVEIRYTTDGSEPTMHSLRLEKAITIEKECHVKAKAFNPKTGQVSPSSSAFFRFMPKNAQPKVHYSYWENDNEAHFQSVFDIPKMGRKVRIGSSYEMRQEHLETRGEKAAFILSGNLAVKEAGFYHFYLRSDDGSRLFVNGKELINNDGDHGVKEKSGKLKLPVGTAHIELHTFNNGGGGWFDLLYSGPKFSKQIIPASAWQ